MLREMMTKQNYVNNNDGCTFSQKRNKIACLLWIAIATVFSYILVTVLFM